MELTFKLKIKDQEIELSEEELEQLYKTIKKFFPTPIIDPVWNKNDIGLPKTVLLSSPIFYNHQINDETNLKHPWGRYKVTCGD